MTMTGSPSPETRPFAMKCPALRDTRSRGSPTGAVESTEDRSELQVQAAITYSPALASRSVAYTAPPGVDERGRSLHGACRVVVECDRPEIEPERALDRIATTARGRR